VLGAGSERPFLLVVDEGGGRRRGAGVQDQFVTTDLDTLANLAALSRVDQDPGKEADQLVGCVQRQHV
jgi:hypothetical protein